MTNDVWQSMIGVTWPKKTSEPVDSMLRTVGADFTVLPLLNHEFSLEKLLYKGYLEPSWITSREFVSKNYFVPQIELYTFYGHDVKGFEICLDFVSHVGYSVLEIVLDFQKDMRLEDLCNLLGTAYDKLRYTQLWLYIKNATIQQQFSLWCNIRFKLNYPKNSFICLDLTPRFFGERWVDKWASEPVKLFRIRKDNWLVNSKGYPVLPRKSQLALQKYVKLWASHFLLDEDFFTMTNETKSLFLKNLIRTTTRTYAEEFSQGYEDVLQIPLQPLKDNLDLKMYEVFHEDQVKYKVYREGIKLALEKRLSSSLVISEPVVITVIGAGSLMPLGECVLDVSDELNILNHLRLVLVEKNPNSITLLKERLSSNPSPLIQKYRDLNDSDIELVFSDVRDFKPDRKSDLIISELLGSFGDNELCPECLSDIERLLKSAEDGPFYSKGSSIPENSRSYISPIQYPTIVGNIRDLGIAKATVPNFESSFVVRLYKYYEPSKPGYLWDFTYPPVDSSKNNKTATVEFTFYEECWIHAIAGYFESDLFSGVTLSNNPESHTPFMMSWFPAVFPLRSPVSVETGDTMKVTFDRKNSSDLCGKVWYEWSAEIRTMNQKLKHFTGVHNSEGYSDSIGL